MNNVTLIFNGVTDNPKYQVNVKIYDDCKLICSGVSKCGKITFCLATNKAYRIEARLLGNYLNTSFYAGKYTRELYFNFFRNINHSIIFNIFLQEKKS